MYGLDRAMCVYDKLSICALHNTCAHWIHDCEWRPHIYKQLRSATHQKTPSHTHKMPHRRKPTDKGSHEQQQRKEIQATGTTAKSKTGKRQRIPKGMRNHTNTGTKGAQTTDNRTEGST